MKKIFISLFAACMLVLTVNHAVEAKGKQDTDIVLTVGATPVPHGQLLNLIMPDLEAEGITLKIVEFTDYVQPNMALLHGDLDANFFQTLPYLDSHREWAEKLIAVFGVHIEPFGLYSSRYKAISDLPNGATIAIPNDPSNGGRALLLLQAKGYIVLRERAGLEPTIRDITRNDRNFRFQELEAAQLPRSLRDVDAACINGNYAISAGLHPLRDALIIEGADSPYVNIVVVRKGMENDPRIVALESALHSLKVKEYIISSYEGDIVPIF